MKTYIIKKVWFIVLFVALSVSWIYPQMPFTNMFSPNDIWLWKPYLTPSKWGFEAAYEHAFDSRAYQYATDEMGNSNCFRKRGDVLQLFEDRQDLLAALKGDAFAAARTQLAQRYNLSGDDGTYGWFIPKANIHIDQLLVSGRWCINGAFSLVASLPIVSYKLSDVAWFKAPGNHADGFDASLNDDFVRDVAAVGGCNFFDYSASGVGDATVQLCWAKSFPQAREILTNVSLNARLGILLPTGKKEDSKALFAPGLGYGGGLGVPGGMQLRMQFGRYMHAGLDVDLLYCFGSSQVRKIKTDRSQTTLTLLDARSTYQDPGLWQKFTLFVEGARFCKGLLVRLGYQYLKQSESRMYVDGLYTDPTLINMREDLDLWTVHSLMGMAAYDVIFDTVSFRLGVTAKWGFNGQRVIACDTVAVQFGYDF